VTIFAFEDGFTSSVNFHLGALPPARDGRRVGPEARFSTEPGPPADRAFFHEDAPLPKVSGRQGSQKARQTAGGEKRRRPLSCWKTSLPPCARRRLEFLQLLDLEDKDYASRCLALTPSFTIFPRKPAPTIAAFRPGLFRQVDRRGGVLHEGPGARSQFHRCILESCQGLAEPGSSRRRPIAVLQDLVERKPYPRIPTKFLGNLFGRPDARIRPRCAFAKSSWLNPKDAAAGKKWSLMPAQILVSHFGDQASPGQAEVEKFIEELLAFGRNAPRKANGMRPRGVLRANHRLSGADPVKNLSGMHATLGEIFERQRKLDKALESFRKAGSNWRRRIPDSITSWPSCWAKPEKSGRPRSSSRPKLR